MKKMWKRVLSFALAVGMVLTANGVSGILTAYAEDEAASAAAEPYVVLRDASGNDYDNNGTISLKKESGTVSLQIVDKNESGRASGFEVSKDSNLFMSNDTSVVTVGTETSDGITAVTLTPVGVGTTTIVVGITYKVDNDTTAMTGLNLTVNVSKSLETSEEIKVFPKKEGSDAYTMYPYTGEGVCPELIFDTARKDYLKESTDYTAKYTDNVDASTEENDYQVSSWTATGCGLYYKSTKGDFTIAQADFSNGNTYADYKYDSNSGTWVEKSTKVVKYVLELSGDGIKKEEGDSGGTSYSYTANYTGYELEPEVKVMAYVYDTTKDADGNVTATGKLVDSYEIQQTANGMTNYEVDYGDKNLFPGIMTVTVTGLGIAGQDGTAISGNCIGTISTRVKIVADFNEKNIKITAPDVSYSSNTEYNKVEYANGFSVAFTTPDGQVMELKRDTTAEDSGDGSDSGDSTSSEEDAAAGDSTYSEDETASGNGENGEDGEEDAAVGDSASSEDGTASEDGDYRIVSYENYENAGTATVTIESTDKTCFQGGEQVSATYTVKPRELSDGIKATVVSQVAGKILTPEDFTAEDITVAFTDHEQEEDWPKLEFGTDYKVVSVQLADGQESTDVANWTEDAEVTLTIEGTGSNYTGQLKSEPFKLRPNIAMIFTDPDQDILLDQDTFVYDGTKHEPLVGTLGTDSNNIERYYLGKNGEKYFEDIDYTVSYSDTLNAGTATVTIKGINGYAGEVTRNYTIKPKNISTKYSDGTDGYEASDAVGAIVVSYEDASGKGTITVSYQNVLEGEDPVVTYQDGKIPSVVYNGKKNAFTVTKVLYYPGVDDDGDPSGEAVSLAFGNDLEKEETDDDFIVDGISGNMNAANCNLRIKAVGSNYTGSLYLNYEITPKDLSDSGSNIVVKPVTTGTTEYVYRGESGGTANRPGVYVYDYDRSETSPLYYSTSNPDYTRTWVHNVNACPDLTAALGKLELKDPSNPLVKTTEEKEKVADAGIPYVEITGKGNYTGTIYYCFAISCRNIANAEFAAIPDQAYTGYPVAVPVTITDTAIGLEKLSASADGKDGSGDYYLLYEADGDGTVDDEAGPSAVGDGYQVSAVGINNYTGTLTSTFNIKYNLAPETVKDGDGATLANQGTVALTVGKTQYSINSSDTSEDVTKITVTDSDNHIAEADYPSQIYTGQKIQPEITEIVYTDPVTAADGAPVTQKLVENKDYTVTYGDTSAGQDNKSLGAKKGVIIIEGTGSYMGTIKLTFDITYANLNNAEVLFRDKGDSSAEYQEDYSKTYTGLAIKPDVIIVTQVDPTYITDSDDSYIELGGKKYFILPDTDYTLQWPGDSTAWAGDCVNAGIKRIKVTGKDGTGIAGQSITAQYEIAPVDLTSDVVGVEEVVIDYTNDNVVLPGNQEGNTATLNPTVKYNGMTLNYVGSKYQYGLDYTVAIEGTENTSVDGVHQFAVTGTAVKENGSFQITSGTENDAVQSYGGNYYGTRIENYSIKYNLSSSVTKIIWYKDGKVDGTTVTGEDGTVTAVDADSYEYVPGGVEPRALAVTSAGTVASYGTGFVVQVADRYLTPGTDYVITGFTDNDTAGTAKLSIGAVDGSDTTIGSKTGITFTVTAIPIAEVKTDDYTLVERGSGSGAYTLDNGIITVVYDGSVQSPKPLVYYRYGEDGEQVLLEEGRHYRLSYNAAANRTDAAAASEQSDWTAEEAKAETAPLITLTGINGFTGTAYLSFTIAQKTLSTENGIQIDLDAFTPLLRLEEVLGSANKERYYAKVTSAVLSDASGNQTDIGWVRGNKNVTVDVSAVINDHIFAQETGCSLYDKFVVADGTYQTLKLGTDYTVQYIPPASGDNEESYIGSYTYKITGAGNYTGSMEYYYAVKHWFAEGTYTAETTNASGAAVSLEKELVTIEFPNITEDSIEQHKEAYTGNAIVSDSKAKELAASGSTQDVTAAKALDANVYFGGVQIYEGTDYTVDFEYNTDPGTAYITFTGIGAYSGTIQKSFTITGDFDVNEDRIVMEEIPDQQYTGSQITPRVKIRWKNALGQEVTLVKDQDYTVAYGENTAVSGWTNPPAYGVVTVTGIGNYSGTLDAQFEIVEQASEPTDTAQIELTAGNLTVEYPSGVSYEYNHGNAVTPTGEKVVYTYTDDDGQTHEIVLARNGDYTVSFLNNTDPGSASVVIQGIQDYTGKVTVPDAFTIIGSFSSGNTAVGVDTIVDKVYTGDPVTPSISVFWSTASDGSRSLTEGVDYTVTYSEKELIGEEDADTVVLVYITGKGYYKGEFSTSFKILAKGSTVTEPAEVTKIDFSDTETCADISIGSGSIPYTGSKVSIADENIVYTTPVASTGTGGRQIVLTEGVDYTLSEIDGQDYVEPGTVEYAVTGLGAESGDSSGSGIRYQCTGSGTISVTITGDLSGGNVEIRGIDPSYGYEGVQVAPTFEVVWTAASGVETILEAGTDYETVYGANDAVGTGTVTVTGKGVYEGTRTVTFAIVDKDDPRITVDDESTVIELVPEDGREADTYTYTGSAVAPAVKSVAVNGTVLSAADLAENFDITYADNVKTGNQAKVILSAKAGSTSYTGSATKYFTIVQDGGGAQEAKGITDDDVVFGSDPYLTEAGAVVWPTVSVTVDGETLVMDRDYTVAQSYNAETGIATVTVEGIGDYTGTVTQGYLIGTSSGGDSGTASTDTRTDISTATVSNLADTYTYTGSQISPVPTVTLRTRATLNAGTDYTVTWRNNINAGTAWLVVTGKGNYTGTLTKEYKIAKKNINNCTIVTSGSTIYTGNDITPAVSVKSGTRTMVAGSDYSVTYKNNKKLGEASLVLKGEGNYTGTKTIYFDVTVAATKNLKFSSSTTGSVTLKWTKVTKATGYEVWTSDLKKKVATVTTNTNKAKVKGLKKAQVNSYRVRAYITQDGKKYYGAFSNAVKTATKPAKVKLSVSSTGAKKAKLTWKKVSGSGYQVYRAASKKGTYKKVATLSSSKKSYTNKNLKSGKTYYYKVRAYKKVGGRKVYGAFSAVKKVTVE